MNINLFYKKTLFSKSIKKRTFKDFGWEIGVRFFFSGSWKNALQFATQNPSKNHIFPQVLEKNAPRFTPQNPSNWWLKKGAFFFFNLKMSIFLRILGGELRCVFLVLPIKKTHPNSPPKIQKGAFFFQKRKKKNCLCIFNYWWILIYFIKKLYFQNQ